MLKIYKILILGFLLLLYQLGFLQAAVFQKIPGTALYATPPKDFVLSDRFSGFVNRDTNSTIVVTTLPPATENWKKLFFNTKDFTTISSINGFTIEKSYTIQTVKNNTLTVYKGQQLVELDSGIYIYYDKWLTSIFMDYAYYQISIQIGRNDDFNDAMAQDFFKSISVDQTVTEEEQLAVLPFTFDIFEPFQFFRTSMNRAAMLMAFSRSEEEERPYIILSKGFENMQGHGLEQILQVYLGTLKGTINDIKNKKVSTIEFAGLPALKLEAQANIDNENSDIIIFATITKDGHPLYMHATVPEHSLKKYTDVIEKIANSVKLRG